jgi:hypothetical protein
MAEQHASASLRQHADQLQEAKVQRLLFSDDLGETGGGDLSFDEADQHPMFAPVDGFSRARTQSGGEGPVESAGGTSPREK